ncbi:MAG: NAD(P)-binding protein, partial [Thermoplasmata archaeon]|nr:NAD(P)-binding protein [Thermoplasmata archaeon]
MHTEIAVVGAGPAGGQAARLLAEEGLAVSLLEMRRRVGTPIQCGEAISATALRKNGLRPGEWVRSSVKGVATHTPGVDQARLETPGYCI